MFAASRSLAMATVSSPTMAGTGISIQSFADSGIIAVLARPLLIGAVAAGESTASAMTTGIPEESRQGPRDNLAHRETAAPGMRPQR